MIREIPEYPSYFASIDGKIYGSKLYNDNRLYELTPYTKNGYKRVRLRVNDTVIDKSVAYLVARTFVKGYKNGLEVNHKNKDRKDNRAENLEWMTRKENVRYSIAKPLEVVTRSGLKLYYNSCQDFSNDTGISTSNLARFYIQKKNGYIKKFELHVSYRL